MSYVRTALPDDLPRLTDYQAASLWFDAVKPFAKGKLVGEKPLGRNRRYNRLMIAKRADEQIVITHYSTDILTYHKDGSFTFGTGGMDSISTCQALQEVLGSDKFTRKQCKIYFKDGNGHFFRIGDKLHVGADGVAINPIIGQVYVLNRKRFKDLKDKYKTFTDYTKQIVALTQGGREKDLTLADAVGLKEGRLYGRYGDWALRTDAYGVNWYGRSQRGLRARFFDSVEKVMQIEDEAERTVAMYPLAQYLSFCSATDWHVHRLTTDIASERCDYAWETSTKRVDKFFGELLKYQYPVMCFDLVDAEYGKVNHNPNAKYISTK